MRAKTTIKGISCLVFRFIGKISRFLSQTRDSPLALFLCFRQVVPDVRFRKRHAHANPPAPYGFPNRHFRSDQALLRKRKPPSLTVGNMITHFPEKRKSLQHSVLLFLCIFQTFTGTPQSHSHRCNGQQYRRRNSASEPRRSLDCNTGKRSAERSFTVTGWGGGVSWLFL